MSEVAEFWREIQPRAIAYGARRRRRQRGWKWALFLGGVVCGGAVAVMTGAGR